MPNVLFNGSDLDTLDPQMKLNWRFKKNNWYHPSFTVLLFRSKSFTFSILDNIELSIQLFNKIWTKTVLSISLEGTMMRTIKKNVFEHKIPLSILPKSHSGKTGLENLIPDMINNNNNGWQLETKQKYLVVNLEFHGQKGEGENVFTQEVCCLWQFSKRYIMKTT